MAVANQRLDSSGLEELYTLTQASNTALYYDGPSLDLLCSSYIIVWSSMPPCGIGRSPREQEL